MLLLFHRIGGKPGKPMARRTRLGQMGSAERAPGGGRSGFGGGGRREARIAEPGTPRVQIEGEPRNPIKALSKERRARVLSSGRRAGGSAGVAGLAGGRRLMTGKLRGPGCVKHDVNVITCWRRRRAGLIG